jgi:hypothetical protein
MLSSYLFPWITSSSSRDFILLCKALGEFKKTTEEIKENIGINELTGIGSSRNRIDLFTDLAEKVSQSMTNREKTGEATIPLKDPGQQEASLPMKVPKPDETGKR